MERINIIIADDEKLFRNSLTSVLSGYNIHTLAEADEGSQVIDILRTNKPDVVILNINLPVQSGSETMDIIISLYPGSKIILLSNYGDEQIIKAHFNRGARAYISKKDSIETLIDAIRWVKSGKVYKENIPALLRQKSIKDKLYYKLSFTKREQEVIEFACSAYSVRDIGNALQISEKTVETHLTEIYRKLNVKNRCEFMLAAGDRGLKYLRSTNPKINPPDRGLRQNSF